MSTLIDQLFDPATLAVNMIGGLVIALVLYGLLAWILPPKSVKVFWSVEISLTVVSLFLKPIMPSLLRIGLNIILSVLLPVSLLSGTLLARVVVCFLGTLALTLGDIVAAFSWMSITGLEVAGSDVLLEHFPVYLAVMVSGDIGVTSLVMTLVHWLKKRFLPADSRDSVGSGAVPQWAYRYGWFPVMQFALLFTLTGIGFDVLRWGGASAAVVGLLFALCLAVDVLLFVQIGRSVAQAQEEVRAAVLEERVGDYLARSERVQALLGETAHLRHDLRNHRMVVEALCERGEYERAEAYLDEFADRLAGE